MKELILASASPRRKQLLEEYGYNFKIEVSDKEGEIDNFTPPDKLAIRCAINKAEDIFEGKGEGVVVLAADTVVCLGGVIFGKPKDISDAERMLKELSGKTHEVITGYAIMTAGLRETGKVTTRVTFNDLSDSQLSTYLKSGLWQGKAGAYGIQDGFDLVKNFEGDYDNVVGLPLKAIDSTVKEFLK